MIKPFFENIRAQILTELDSARTEILVAIYWFTNHQLFEKLCSKLEMGIKVSIIIHNDFINNREHGLDFQSFIELGGELFFSDSQNPMHNKFCIIDKAILINGSYNWTYFAESKNNENILIIKDENETIEAFHKEFDAIKERVIKIDHVVRLTTFEIDEFNGLNSREYLANDIIYEAKATNRPEIVERAFKLSPENINVQKEAVKLDLTKKRRLLCSIGAEMKDNKYLIGVSKGSLLPISITRSVVTSADNQTMCSSAIYYGENELANNNKKMPNKGTNGHLGGVLLRGLPKLPAGEARMKMIFTIDLYAKLQVKFYSLDNGQTDYYRVDAGKLVTESNDNE